MIIFLLDRYDPRDYHIARIDFQKIDFGGKLEKIYQVHTSSILLCIYKNYGVGNNYFFFYRLEDIIPTNFHSKVDLGSMGSRGAINSLYS